MVLNVHLNYNRKDSEICAKPENLVGTPARHDASGRSLRIGSLRELCERRTFEATAGWRAGSSRKPAPKGGCCGDPWIRSSCGCTTQPPLETCRRKKRLRHNIIERGEIRRQRLHAQPLEAHGVEQRGPDCELGQLADSVILRDGVLDVMRRILL